MNKKGDEHWSTISAAVLIIIALLVVFFVYSDSFAEIKKGFEKVADSEAIKKAYDKTLGKEDALTEEEKKTIDEFNLFFKDNFAVADDDCLKEINFDAIKGKGFGIRVRNGNVYAEKEGKARAHQLNAPFRMYLYFSDRPDEFSIDESFEKINSEFELANFVYFKDKKSYFLEKNINADFYGLYSDVIRPRTCGEAEKKSSVANVEGEGLLLDYLNGEFTYMQKKYIIAELIAHVHKLKTAQYDAYEVFNKWEEIWKRHTSDYFYNVRGYSNAEDCIILIVSNGDSFSYGKGDYLGREKTEEAKIALVENGNLKLELYPLYPAPEGCVLD